MNEIIKVSWNIISVVKVWWQDYISLTDLARQKNSEEPKNVIQNWMRWKDVLAFLGLWEQLNNPNFKGTEFDAFKNEAGFNAFTMSP
jgi:hypothetical protein